MLTSPLPGREDQRNEQLIEADEASFMALYRQVNG